MWWETKTRKKLWKALQPLNNRELLLVYGWTIGVTPLYVRVYQSLAYNAFRRCRGCTLWWIACNVLSVDAYCNSGKNWLIGACYSNIDREVML